MKLKLDAIGVWWVAGAAVAVLVISAAELGMGPIGVPGGASVAQADDLPAGLWVVVWKMGDGSGRELHTLCLEPARCDYGGSVKWEDEDNARYIVISGDGGLVESRLATPEDERKRYPRLEREKEREKVEVKQD